MEQLDSIQGINVAWKANNTYLIFIMQLGFSLIEAGTIRYNNIQSILLKNMIDVCISALCWWLCGYGIAYGDSYKGFFGQDNYIFGNNEELTGKQYIHWVNQWTIASTSSTIVSGSVAERLPIFSYMVYCIIMMTVIYPPLIHLIWNEKGFLKELGFIDFAGSGAVHMMGGLCGLIATWIIGPRQGRFEKKQNQKFEPQQAPFIVMGTLFLWFSWFGFNCGSVEDIHLPENRRKIGQIAINTVLSASAGALYGFSSVQIYNLRNKKNPKDIVQFNIKTSMGILAGLISITGCCNYVEPYFAIIIGIVGTQVYLSLSQLLIMRKIDDPIDASPLHFGCGLWGTIATGIFHKKEGLVASDGVILQQLIGVLIILTWSGIITLIYFKILKKFDWHYTKDQNNNTKNLQDAMLQQQSQNQIVVQNKNRTNNSNSSNSNLQNNVNYRGNNIRRDSQNNNGSIQSSEQQQPTSYNLQNSNKIVSSSSSNTPKKQRQPNKFKDEKHNNDLTIINEIELANQK